MSTERAILRLIHMSEQRSIQSQASKPDDHVADQALGFVEQWQAELDALREQITAMNRMGQLGMLTAALAHETNNLLTPIRSYAQLALKNTDDTLAVQRALRVAIEGTQKITALTERVIDLAGPNHLIQTGVCCCSVVSASAIQDLSLLTRQQGVRVKTDVEPVSVRIDALSLEQVLINLIGNACHAMRGMSRQQVIRLSSRIDGESVVLSISDTGPGVPAEIREEIFEAFVTSKQGDRSKSSDTQPAGSGLGLNICRQLIESAGGEIKLARSSEGGSVFEITLPIAIEQ
jgi:two-component system sensor kinase FixL